MGEQTFALDSTAFPIDILLEPSMSTHDMLIGRVEISLGEEAVARTAAAFSWYQHKQVRIDLPPLTRIPE